MRKWLTMWRRLHNYYTHMQCGAHLPCNSIQLDRNRFYTSLHPRPLPSIACIKNFYMWIKSKEFNSQQKKMSFFSLLLECWYIQCLLQHFRIDLFLNYLLVAHKSVCVCLFNYSIQKKPTIIDIYDICWGADALQPLFLLKNQFYIRFLFVCLFQNQLNFNKCAFFIVSLQKFITAHRNKWWHRILAWKHCQFNGEICENGECDGWNNIGAMPINGSNGSYLIFKNLTTKRLRADVTTTATKQSSNAIIKVENLFIFNAKKQNNNNETEKKF